MRIGFFRRRVGDIDLFGIFFFVLDADTGFVRMGVVFDSFRVGFLEFFV